MDNLFRETVEKWGVAPQVTAAMEECGELTAALNQYFFRSRITREELAQEVADVELVCQQIRYLIGDDCVDAAKAEKIERIKVRLNETETHGKKKEDGKCLG